MPGVALGVTLLVSACRGGPPPPAPAVAASPAADDALAPLSSRATVAPAAATAERPDPGEPGISDLARLARHVFREMGEREGSCRLVNPLHGRLRFTLRLGVERGRIRAVSLASAHLEDEGGATPLAEARWPPELRAYVACLEPFLEARELTPAPADDVYDAEYSFAGHREGAS